MLDLSEIKQIQTIAKLGSMNKAAEVLNMSQPTLSKRLSRLEDKLNITLFHRHNGGMQPTEAANYIINVGDSLNGQMQAIERHIELMADLKEGKVNLGIGPIIEQLYLPKVILDFTEKTERIKVSIRTESPNHLLSLLEKGEIDIAVGPFNPEHFAEELQSFSLQPEGGVTVVRKDHPVLSKTGDEQILETLKYPIISPHIPEHMMADLIELGLKLEPEIVCDNYSTSKTVVLNSDYITGGPEALFAKEIKAGDLVKLEVELPIFWTAYCVTKPETLLIPAVNSMVDIFRDYAC